MLNIEAIELNRLTIHGINQLADKPEIAEKEEVLSEGMRFFFEEHILNCVKSTSVKAAKFTSAETTLSQCAATLLERPDDFIEQSKVIGLWFAHNMQQTGEVRTFLAVASFTDTDTRERYLACLKLDPVRAIFKNADGTFDEITILPDPGRQLNRYAIISPYDEDSRNDIWFRNQAASRDEDRDVAGMWLEGFLEAYEVATPRQMTQLVVKETEKWIAANDEQMQPDEINNLRGGVRAMSQSDEMDVEEIAKNALAEERMREEYISRLVDSGLAETQFTPDRGWAMRQAKKTTYVCDDNVTVSGPSDAIDQVVQILPKTTDRKTRVVIETKKFAQK